MRILSVASELFPLVKTGGLADVAGGLAHLVLGGADMVVAPSRDEPCGLVQLVGLRYGTIPVLARVGGLADTVIDTNEAALEDGVATGFRLAPVEAWALADANRRAVEVYRRPEVWCRLVTRATSRDVGWGKAARRYLELYRGLLATRGAGPGLTVPAAVGTARPSRRPGPAGHVHP